MNNAMGESTGCRKRLDVVVFAVGRLSKFLKWESEMECILKKIFVFLRLIFEVQYGYDFYFGDGKFFI